MKKSIVKSVGAGWLFFAAAGAAQTTVNYNSGDTNWSKRAPGAGDTVAIRTTLTLDTDASVNIVRVNNQPAPTEGTLIINQNYTLTTAGNFQLGTGTGDGYVNQSAGTVTVGNQLQIAGGTNNSIYNLSAGTLNAKTVTISAGGLLTLSGGVMTNNQGITISGGGKISVTSGVARIAGGSATTNLTFNNVVFEVSDGSLYLDGMVIMGAGSEFRVIGSKADIHAGRINNNSASATGTYFFKFDESGVSAIQSAGFMNLTYANVVIDGTKFTGGTGRFDLFKGDYNTAVNTNNVTITGFNSYSNAYLYHNTTENKFQLVVESEPPSNGLFVSICVAEDMNEVNERREKALLFYRLDRNKDGFVTPDEWNVQESTFNRYDTDHDGKLSKAELDEFPVSNISWNGTVRKNIVYKKINGLSQLMDVYYPANFTGEKAPVVVYSHGGGWTVGSKSGFGSALQKPVFEKLSAAGIICASINYRLVFYDGDALVPDCIADLKDAVRFLVENAGEYKIDVNRIGLFGDSAGAQMAMVAGLEPAMNIAAIAEWFGPADFIEWDPDGASTSRFGPRLGGTVEEIPEIYRQMSPVFALTETSPPLLAIHGDGDTSIPISQSRRLKARGDETGASVDYVEVKNAGHNWRNAGGAPQPPVAEIQQITADFLIRNLTERAK